MSMSSVDSSASSRMHSVASLAGMPSNQNFFDDDEFNNGLSPEPDGVDRAQVEQWTRDAMGDLMSGLRSSLGSLIKDEVHALGKQMKRHMSDQLGGGKKHPGKIKKAVSVKQMQVLHASKKKQKAHPHHDHHRRAYDGGDGRKGPPVVGDGAGVFTFSNTARDANASKKKG